MFGVDTSQKIKNTSLGSRHRRDSFPVWLGFSPEVNNQDSNIPSKIHWRSYLTMFNMFLVRKKTGYMTTSIPSENPRELFVGRELLTAALGRSTANLETSKPSSD